MLQNIYLNLILLAVLMFLDYFLTVRAHKLYLKKYCHFIEAEEFELNPRMQEKIKEHKYSFLHLAGTIAVLVVIYLGYTASRVDPFLEELYISFIQGVLIFPYVYIISNHLRNISIYKYVSKNPDFLTGKVKQNYLFSLFSAKKNDMAVTIMLFFIFVFRPSFLVFCAIIGMLMFNITFWRWKRIVQKREKIMAKNNV